MKQEVIRRFVLIKGDTLIQYVNAKRQSVWKIDIKMASREELLKSIETVRLYKEKS